MIAGQLGDAPTAELLGRRALARGRRTGDVYVIIRAIILLQPLTMAADIVADESSAAEALELAITARDHSAQIILYPMAAVEALVHGQPRRAGKLCDEALTLAAAARSDPSGHPSDAAVWRASRCTSANRRGSLSCTAWCPSPWTCCAARSPRCSWRGSSRPSRSPGGRSATSGSTPYSGRRAAVPQTEVIARASAIARLLADSPQPGRRTPRRTPPPRHVGEDELTARECEVLRFLAGGGTNKEIAVALRIDVKTAMHHTSSIYRKLGVRGRVEAACLGLAHGRCPQPVARSPHDGRARRQPAF